MLCKLVLSGALALAAPVAVYAQNMPAVASSPARSTSAVDYVMKAGQSDQFELTEAKLAQSMGRTSAVKRFGAQMIRDHTKSTKMVMTAAAKSGMPSAPPPPLRPDQRAMVDELKQSGPSQFDKTYVSQQLQAHQDALALHSGYAQSGGDKNLKTAAGKITPVVQMHLDMLQKMQRGM